MYSGSPRIVSDEHGNKVVQRGAKSAAEALADPSLSEKAKKSLVLKQKHEKELLELAQKHEQEQEEFTPETATATATAAVATPAT
jgi:hypothetical protein